MSCMYHVEFKVAIRPDAVHSLRKAIDAANLLDAFSIGARSCRTDRRADGDGPILYCEFNGPCSLSTAADIEDIAKGPVSEAAVDTVLVTEQCNNDTKVYGVGPDAIPVLSAHRLAEVLTLVEDLTMGDLAKALKVLEAKSQLR